VTASDRPGGRTLVVDDLAANHDVLQRLLMRDGHSVITDDLEPVESMLLALATTIEARDPYTLDHCQRLARYATEFGRRLGLPGEDLRTLAIGGLLHDLGKIAVPDAVLTKPGPLTPDERAVMQRHPIVGDKLCAPLSSLEAVRPIVRHHHELSDGSGYPDHLAGDDIPLLAEIMGIVDVFDALTTDRPYRRALSVANACAILQRDAARGRRRHRLVESFVGRPPVLCPASRSATAAEHVLPVPWAHCGSTSASAH
jgi:putative two-component system response regulator